MAFILASYALCSLIFRLMLSQIQYMITAVTALTPIAIKTVSSILDIFLTDQTGQLPIENILIAVVIGPVNLKGELPSHHNG